MYSRYLFKTCPDQATCRSRQNMVRQFNKVWDPRLVDKQHLRPNICISCVILECEPHEGKGLTSFNLQITISHHCIQNLVDTKHVVVDGLHEWMDGWTDGQSDGSMDWWVSRWMGDGWIDGWTDGWICAGDHPNSDGDYSSADKRAHIVSDLRPSNCWNVSPQTHPSLQCVGFLSKQRWAAEHVPTEWAHRKGSKDLRCLVQKGGNCLQMSEEQSHGSNGSKAGGGSRWGVGTSCWFLSKTKAVTTPAQSWHAPHHHAPAWEKVSYQHPWTLDPWVHSLLTFCVMTQKHFCCRPEGAGCLEEERLQGCLQSRWVGHFLCTVVVN